MINMINHNCIFCNSLVRSFNPTRCICSLNVIYCYDYIKTKQFYLNENEYILYLNFYENWYYEVNLVKTYDSKTTGSKSIYANRHKSNDLAISEFKKIYYNYHKFIENVELLS